MPTIPPWLQPQDFIKAASAGAAAGLQRAQIDTEGNAAAARLKQAREEAAGRLGLAYAQLDASKNEAAAANALRQKLGFAELESKMQSDAAAQALRANEFGLNADKFGLEQEKFATESTNATDKLKLEQEKFANDKSSPLSAVAKLQADLTAARTRGDDEAAKALETAIQQETTNKGRSIYVGQSDDGSPIFELTEGGAKSRIGDPTVATKSKVQEKMMKYENSVELLTQLEKNLKPEHVGLSGAGGELLFDRSLAQLIPGAANTNRVAARTALIAAKEGLMREISDDSRFSNADREQISKALPSSGVFESFPDAMQRIKSVKQILANRGKVFSRGVGSKVPLWSMSQGEIREALQKKEITEDEALDALIRFHADVEN